MKTSASFLPPSFFRRLFLTVSLLIICISWLDAQARYRTFDQLDLSLKKAHEGKVLGSTAGFTFRNTSGFTVSSLHAKFNSYIVAVLDSGGYPSLTVTDKNKGFNATGLTVANGDSVSLYFRINKKPSGIKVSSWSWDTNGTELKPKNGPLLPSSSLGIYSQPNGGNIRDYIYKFVIERPNGLVIGMPTDTPNVGWVRYLKSDAKYFPHTDSARGFDSLIAGMGHEKAFVGEHKNLHVDKHNNHLLGEVHALKLAIIANDSGTTEPDSPATRLGDLVYFDSTNSGDPCNTLTLRGITHLSDSALTYHYEFSASFYAHLDSCVSKINRAFDGPDSAVSFKPYLIAGTHTLAEVSFLHSGPVISPVTIHRKDRSAGENVPLQVELRQNYPNPFNPTTLIRFDISQQAVVTLKVYNLLGQEVATLLNRQEMNAGDQAVQFSAGNLASGIYFYRINVDGQVGQSYQAIQRMVLLK